MGGGWRRRGVGGPGGVVVQENRVGTAEAEREDRNGGQAEMTAL